MCCFRQPIQTHFPQLWDKTSTITARNKTSPSSLILICPAMSLYFFLIYWNLLVFSIMLLILTALRNEVQMGGRDKGLFKKSWDGKVVGMEALYHSLLQQALRKSHLVELLDRSHRITKFRLVLKGHNNALHLSGMGIANWWWPNELQRRYSSQDAGVMVSRYKKPQFHLVVLRKHCQFLSFFFFFLELTALRYLFKR